MRKDTDYLITSTAWPCRARNHEINLYSGFRCKNEEAIARLKIMCSTSDGFRIADEDLRLRGPGDFWRKATWFT